MFLFFLKFKLIVFIIYMNFSFLRSHFTLENESEPLPSTFSPSPPNVRLQATPRSSLKNPPLPPQGTKIPLFSLYSFIIAPVLPVPADLPSSTYPRSVAGVSWKPWFYLCLELVLRSVNSHCYFNVFSFRKDRFYKLGPLSRIIGEAMVRGLCIELETVPCINKNSLHTVAA